MDSFTYTDLFASKGWEYLLVIGMLLVFVPFWLRLKAPARAVIGAVKKIVPVIREWFRLPEGFFFHRGHSWARPEEGEVVRVGIDDFAQKLVGPIQAIKVPPVGSTVTQGETGWTLTADSRSVPMLSPVDGKVVDVNEWVLHSPDKVKTDPYGEAWLMKVSVPGASSNLKNLLSGELARDWLDQDRERLMARMGAEALGTVLQDGGMPVDGMARSLDPNRWDDIVKEFFLTT
jgi:glycine cleavage system H lipoate-binding protein